MTMAGMKAALMVESTAARLAAWKVLKTVDWKVERMVEMTAEKMAD